MRIQTVFYVVRGKRIKPKPNLLYDGRPKSRFLFYKHIDKRYNKYSNYTYQKCYGVSDISQLCNKLSEAFEPCF